MGESDQNRIGITGIQTVKLVEKYPILGLKSHRN
jgi:hypothetical protein